MREEKSDAEIVQLLWERKEEGLAAIQEKYTRYCRLVAERITGSREDAEECLNDAWLRIWESIPPHRPENLAGYLAKIVRNLAIGLYRKQHRQKRGGDAVSVALEELSECLSDGKEISAGLDRQALTDTIAAYLRKKSKKQRTIFIRRYFYMMGVKEVAETMQLKENTVKSILSRMRRELKAYLEKEGIIQ